MLDTLEKLQGATKNTFQSRYGVYSCSKKDEKEIRENGKPDLAICCIAISGGVDSVKGDNNFMPFRNLFKNTDYGS